jgi:hypothetical protein
MTVLQRLILLAAVGCLLLGWPTAATGSVELEMELQQAARRFRVTTYQHFRNERTTYERRARGSRALIDRWRSQGSAPQDARDLIAWFEDAIEATEQGRALEKLPYQSAALASAPPRIILEAMPEPPQATTNALSAPRRESRRKPLPALAEAPLAVPVPPVPPRNRAFRPNTTPLRMSTRVAAKNETPNQSTELIEASAAELPDLAEADAAAFDSPNVKTPVSMAERDTIAVTRELPATINTKQLTQRLLRHNRSMRALEQKLHLNDNWTIEGLEKVLQSLEDLATRYHVWNLYANSLSAADRRQIGSAKTFDTCLELIKQRVFELQIVNEAEPMSQNAAEQSRRLHAIDERVRRWPIQ